VHGTVCAIRISTTTTHAPAVGPENAAADMPGKVGMCARWQIGQVSAEPGASLCQNTTPTASSERPNKALAKPTNRIHLTNCVCLFMQVLGNHNMFGIYDKRYSRACSAADQRRLE
jgi:hypothetical protein